MNQRQLKPFSSGLKKAKSNIMRVIGRVRHIFHLVKAGMGHVFSPGTGKEEVISRKAGTRWVFPIALAVLLSCSRCRDRNQQGEVPYVPVNITINVNQPDFFNLSVPTGWVYVTGGSRGIIIYRNSTTEFTALERHSTYEPENQCAVAVMQDGVLLKDPCSESRWLIQDGSIVDGPTSFPLIQYETTFQDPYLYITN